MISDTYKSDLVDVECLLLRETDKAYGVANNLGKGKPSEVVWLPKSQVEWDSDAKIMTVPEWLAAEKALI